jgi:uncharacterized protein (DUF427 family)
LSADQERALEASDQLKLIIKETKASSRGLVVKAKEFVVGSNPGTVYWMDVSHGASYYIKKKKKKSSQMGHSKTTIKNYKGDSM